MIADPLIDDIRFPQRKYWVFKHKPGTDGSNESMAYVRQAYEQKICMMQYEYGHEESGQPKNKVTQNWQQIAQVKEGDVVFLRGDNKLYAVGIVIKHGIKKNSGIPQTSIKETIQMASHGQGNHLQSYEANGYVCFSDSEVFYEDFSDGADGWGQRIKVDRWRYFTGQGLDCKGNANFEGQNVYLAIRELKKDTAISFIRRLKDAFYKRIGMNPEILDKRKNLVLTGAPGTGKTYLAWQIASAMTGDPCPLEAGNEKAPHPHIAFCQFHPSMDYTDFVEGLRPVKGKTDKTSIGFERRDGIFKEFCRKAARDKSNSYVFIIDEINRGDISKIFGELFFAIDPGYRGPKGTIKTQYDNLVEEDKEFGEGFYVPENVYIIGTMNDIDRGVESMDFAIRRRFAWMEITPENTQATIFASKDNLKNNQDAKNRMDNLNAAIWGDPDLGPSFQIGGAYFTKLVGDNYADLWDVHIAPLLREYLRGHERETITTKLTVFKDAFNDTKKRTPTGDNSAEDAKSLETLS